MFYCRMVWTHFFERFMSWTKSFSGMGLRFHS